MSREFVFVAQLNGYGVCPGIPWGDKTKHVYLRDSAGNTLTFERVVCSVESYSQLTLVAAETSEEVRGLPTCILSESPEESCTEAEVDQCIRIHDTFVSKLHPYLARVISRDPPADIVPLYRSIPPKELKRLCERFLPGSSCNASVFGRSACASSDAEGSRFQFTATRDMNQSMCVMFECHACKSKRMRYLPHPNWEVVVIAWCALARSHVVDTACVGSLG